MSTWEDIQTRIKSRHPDLKTLPLLVRLKLRMFEHPLIVVDCFKEETGEYSQTYKTFRYKGETYFWKFGW